MKKSLLFLLLSIFIFSGCNLSVNEPTYSVGSTGQAGGIIFYDCDADNDSGNSDGLISETSGWRFLEAAPRDLSYIHGVSTVNFDEDFRQHFHYGYYRKNVDTQNLFANDSSIELSTTKTSPDIGKGKANTELLVAAMGITSYNNFAGTGFNDCPAKICADLEYGGKSDWFLPSVEELKLVYSQRNIIGNFDPMPLNRSYWTSTEATVNTAYRIDFFNNGLLESVNRDESTGIRTIRRFL
jgi:hypothetical protein